jgi:type IV pilus assembly protein PilC
LFGPVLRRNLIARWCDAMATALGAGLDLPASIDLASSAINSPLLAGDGQVLISAISSGRPLADVRLRIIPATVPAVLDLAAAGKDLPSALDTLGQMHQQQAELRLATIPAVLTPWLFILIGTLIGFVVLAMFAPMISLFRSMLH